MADRILPIATIQPKVDPEQDPSPVDQAEKPFVPSNLMTPTNPATSEILQKPSHGRDPMDFRKEQRKAAQELAQELVDKIEATNQPSLPKTGQVTSPWTLFGFLGLMLTSLLSLGKAHKDE
ncbi:MAG: LPXTG cell wall anchor domain-containing protein [Streptococcus sp.]